MGFKKYFTALATISFGAIMMIGCDPATTSYRDYLDATVNVKGNDGVTPVSGLAFTHDWVISFTDGSTVLERFEDPSFVTGADGSYQYRSGQLDLHSGNLNADCTTVCVDYDYYYEYVCTVWDEDGFCIWYEPYEVAYCAQYGQDCDYYYPARTVKSIESAHSEITYMWGNSFVTTPSQDITFAEDAFTSRNTPQGENDTLVEMLWTQSDVFISPFVTKAAVSGKSKLARKPVARKPSIVTPSTKLSELSAEKKAKLEEVRKLWGATKR